MITDSKLVHPENALAPIDSTLPGMTTDSRFFKSLKQFSPTAVTPSSIMTCFTLKPFHESAEHDITPSPDMERISLRKLESAG